MKSMLTVFIALLGMTASLSAQPTARITGWYDGRGVENGFPDDGVPHGSYGLVGAGPFHRLWIPPIGTGYLTHIVRDPTQPEACGLTNIGGFPAVVLSLNNGVDVQNDLYTFLGNMVADWIDFVNDGPTQDPLASIVRYSNGLYDLQGDAGDPNDRPLLYFPNPGIDPTPTSPTAQYLWGHGPLFTVVKGPTLPNGDSLYMFFGGVRGDQDKNSWDSYGVANGAHAFGIATSKLSDVVPTADGGHHHIHFDFNRGLTEAPRHMGWLDVSSANYTGLRDAGAKVKRWDATLGQEVDGWFTPLFARIATRYYSGDNRAYISRFGPIAGLYADGYFYLFIGVTGYSVKGAIGLRIPSDTTQPYGLGRNADGSIKVEMWYIDSVYPAGAYRPIDSTKPITFSDDDQAGTNPAVPIEQALLRITGSSLPAYLDWPAGPFQSPSSSSTFFMTTRNFYGAYPHLLRLQYSAANPLNPWSIAVAYELHADGQCPGCPGTWVPGNYTMPSRYGLVQGNAVLYPLSSSSLLGYWDVGLAACGGVGGGGLLPFTVDNVDLAAQTLNCSYTAAPASSNVVAAGGTVTVTLTAGSTCAWSAASGAPSFLAVAPGSGAGSGTVTITVAPNTGGQRTGTVTVGGQTVTVTQDAGVRRRAARSLSATGSQQGTAGVPVSITVTALDALSSVITDYDGTVSFASTDGSATLPAAYTFLPSDAGAHTFQAILRTTGAQTLTISEIGGTAYATKTITVSALPAPTGVQATFDGSSAVNLSWTPVAGATGYSIYRFSHLGAPSASPLVTLAATTSYSDSQIGVGLAQAGTAGQTYLYAVRALANGSTSDLSNVDYAATFTFSDPTVIRNATLIRGAHIGQLRFAIDSVRDAVGLSRVWTSYQPEAGQIFSSQLLDQANGLRSALNAARSLLTLSAWPFTYSGQQFTKIHKEDITELRSALR